MSDCVPELARPPLATSYEVVETVLRRGLDNELRETDADLVTWALRFVGATTPKTSIVRHVHSTPSSNQEESDG